MTTSTLQRISSLLSEVGARSTFSAKRSRPGDDLHIEVRGLGRLKFPVSRRQATELCKLGRPARYGQGELTLLDPNVRDTWEIPKSRVKIDLRRWKKTLLPMLGQLGTDLGLPDGSRLKAELHAMLVYAPGQFFLPHQDSEKTDKMIGTLVVTLPSSFNGGALVVRHQSESATYRGSKKYLSFVAFYADCQHEVRPVKEGYRISLTYNLILDHDETTASSELETTAPGKLDALVDGLHKHFETPLPPRWGGEKATPREAPSRLAYLLDHQYTERGLSWERLKGKDAARTAALKEAAERYGCEVVLALTEIHETWSCFDPSRDDHWGQKHRSWQRDGDEAWQEDNPISDDPESYDLQDLIDGTITLTRWIDSSGKQAKPAVTDLSDEEVCFTTPSSALAAYASEYEGFMGNYGNTMDRWYRRASIVLWPRGRAFAVRAEASSTWALETLWQDIRSGQVSEAQTKVTSILSFWATVAQREKQQSFFAQALQVAAGLEDSALAASLLQPFRNEMLVPGQASTFVSLVRLYGKSWARSLLKEWSSHQHLHEANGLTSITKLPRLCKALYAVDSLGQHCAKMLLENRWERAKEHIEGNLCITSPKLRSKALSALAKPIFGILESAEIVGAKSLGDKAVALLCAKKSEALLPCLVRMLRIVNRAKAKKRAAPNLATIEHYCVEQLTARLTIPARTKGNWTINPPADCHCGLCTTLGVFLADPEQQHLEWPLAKQRRRHVHSQLDQHELPVHHRTRRSGSPYTLLLSKTEKLFSQEAKERRTWQNDLDWLNGPSS